MKIDESLHPAVILTKPLQGRGFVYKRARVLGLEGGVPPPPKAQSGDGTGPKAAAQGAAGLAEQPSGPARKRAATPAGAGMAARYEQPRAWARGA